MLMAILPYLLILSAFIGGAYLVIDTTAGERERQSLEPLLATPASRGAIVSGKIVAASLVRSEEHTSELQSLMRISYAVFCLKKKKRKNNDNYGNTSRRE